MRFDDARKIYKQQNGIIETHSQVAGQSCLCKVVSLRGILLRKSGLLSAGKRIESERGREREREKVREKELSRIGVKETLRTILFAR